MEIVDEKDNRAAPVRTVGFTCGRRRSALGRRLFKLHLARCSGDHVFKEIGRNRLTVDFEYELILAQTVDEFSLLINNHDARLDEFRGDSYRLVGRFLLLLLGENDGYLKGCCNDDNEDNWANPHEWNTP